MRIPYGIAPTLNQSRVGVVRFESVLSPDMCDLVREALDQQLARTLEEHEESDLLPEQGFGTVLVRSNRYDMYVRFVFGCGQSASYSCTYNTNRSTSWPSILWKAKIHCDRKGNSGG